ncbi:MAG: hypothetical protein DRH17_00910 [Deltaproteobacteria bacterium]|nr:MAG: hypothetical protein DRH17_00910 [Deltaproteobacteria bacterium]
MKISVVTGTYNHIKLLPKLYQSLKNQTYKHFEWIICDDGSNDGTWELIQDYASEDWVEGFAQTNKGMRLARSLNNGIRHAKGNPVFFVMGDSYLDVDTLEKLAQSYIPQSAGSGLRRHVNEDGSFHSWEWRYRKNLDGLIVKLKACITDQNVKIHPFAHLTGNSMIVSKEHLEKIGYWPEEYEGYGRDDLTVFLRLERLGVELYMYNNIIINHVWHGEGGADNPKNIELFEKELISPGFDRHDKKLGKAFLDR